MRFGDEAVNKCDLSSLRILGTVGEPINPEAWLWYYKVVGKERCYLADTWWQTETGGHMLTGLPGVTPMKPGATVRVVAWVVGAPLAGRRSSSLSRGSCRAG